MKRKTIVILACVIVAAAVCGVLVKRAMSAKNGGTFQYGEVKRGDIVNTVSSTGTVNAVNSVNVGAQVSGIIDSLYVDFNSGVKAGQVLAVLDTTIVASQVFDARAGMLRSKAQLNQAQAEYDRNKPLYENGYLSATEFITIKTNYEAAGASYQSAEAALKRALRNLEYTTITSPIDGTVIQRSVDAGQTIQASFQAPTLFVIAADMQSMQIEVNVDESDIGLIKEGLNVRFTVQAYPDENFTGTVRQVRLQPVTIQNVVNYIVVVDASNESGHLLPGMTATVDFLIDEKDNVLLVPNSALSFKPDPVALKDFIAKVRENMGGGREDGSGAHAGPPREAAEGRGGRDGSGARGDGAALSGRAGGIGGSGGPGGPGRAGPSGGPPRVFYLDKDGSPRIAFFTPGVTDGRNTEITGDGPLTEGMQVVTGFAKAQKIKGPSKSPFAEPPHGPGGRH